MSSFILPFKIYCWPPAQDIGCDSRKKFLLTTSCVDRASKISTEKAFYPLELSDYQKVCAHTGRDSLGHTIYQGFQVMSGVLWKYYTGLSFMFLCKFCFKSLKLYEILSTNLMSLFSRKNFRASNTDLSLKTM